ncbi:uncharacterized protein LOC144477519 [Augochlora pura]
MTWTDTYNPLEISNDSDVDNYIVKDVAKARKELITARRRAQRQIAKQEDPVIINTYQNIHKDKKKKLKKEINKAKDNMWQTLIDSVEHDPWGKPYKWVINTLRKRLPPTIMEDNDITTIVDKLFITNPNECTNRIYNIQDMNTEEEALNENEVLAAVKKVKKKAMGLDKIPSEAVWALGNNALGHLTHLFNMCYNLGYFPQRLNKHITYRDNQYGFCKGKGTIHAIDRIIKFWDKAKSRRHHYSQNSNLRWRSQGSVLGPMLWNAQYDGLLGLTLPKFVELVGFADDVALIASARNAVVLEEKINESLKTIKSWFKENSLILAEEKTELLYLTPRKNTGGIEINIGSKINPAKKLKYLGLYLEGDRRFKHHIKEVCERATRLAGLLSRILPNLRGAGHKIRTLYYNVLESVLLYGAPILASGLNNIRSISTLHQTQKLGLCRLVRSYHTVSHEALCVLAGQPPLILKAEERKKVFYRSLELDGNDSQLKQKINAIKKEEREKTIVKWQERWDHSARGRTTSSLIRDIKSWIEWGPAVLDFHLTQVLTGHGCFSDFLFRIGKHPDNKCILCHNCDDSPEHTLFLCQKNEQDRLQLFNITGQFGINQLIEKIKKEDYRQPIKEFITDTLKRKEEEREGKKKKEKHMTQSYRHVAALVHSTISSSISLISLVFILLPTDIHYYPAISCSIFLISLDIV